MDQEKHNNGKLPFLDLEQLMKGAVENERVTDRRGFDGHLKWIQKSLRIEALNREKEDFVPIEFVPKTQDQEAAMEGDMFQSLLSCIGAAQPKHQDLEEEAAQLKDSSTKRFTRNSINTKKKIGENGSRKRKIKDPNAPKRPMSGYFFWLNDNREQLKQDNPGISIIEISKKAGEMWRAVQDKTEWDEKAKQAKVIYTKAMEEYDKNKPNTEDEEDFVSEHSSPKKKKKCWMLPAEYTTSDLQTLADALAIDEHGNINSLQIQKSCELVKRVFPTLENTIQNEVVSNVNVGLNRKILSNKLPTTSSSENIFESHASDFNSDNAEENESSVSESSDSSDFVDTSSEDEIEQNVDNSKEKHSSTSTTLPQNENEESDSVYSASDLEEGYICLLDAVQKNDVREVKKWIRSGVELDDDMDDEGYTPLSAAAEDGNYEMIKILIDAGTRLEVCGITSRSNHFLCAKDAGHKKCLKLLLDAKNGSYKRESYRKKETDKNLMVAVQANNVKEVERLIKTGVDLNNQDDDEGYTPLSVAAKNGNEEMIKTLIDAGTNTCLDDSGTSWRQNHFSFALEGGHLKCLKLLIDSQKWRHKFDHSMLMQAAGKGEKKNGPALVKYLLEEVNTNIDQIYLNRALEKAVKKGSPKSAQFLMQFGAKVKSSKWLAKQKKKRFSREYVNDTFKMLENLMKRIEKIRKDGPRVEWSCLLSLGQYHFNNA